LGIGDQGVGGILISVAKLVIYTLCAGKKQWAIGLPKIARIVVATCDTPRPPETIPTLETPLTLPITSTGIHPNRVLPVVLDVGTDNHELLDDDLYLGLRRPRVRGERYDDFVDRFIRACRQRYPRA
jgi:malate dehydrogenase (oxaloacetate-decarboxylating)